MSQQPRPRRRVGVGVEECQAAALGRAAALGLAERPLAGRERRQDRGEPLRIGVIAERLDRVLIKRGADRVLAEHVVGARRPDQQLSLVDPGQPARRPGPAARARARGRAARRPRRRRAACGPRSAPRARRAAPSAGRRRRSSGGRCRSRDQAGSPSAGDPLERLRLREVKLRALAREQVVVEDLAQQRMAEAEPPESQRDDDLRLERLAHRRVAAAARSAPVASASSVSSGAIGDGERAQQALAHSESRSTRSSSASRRLGGSEPRPSTPAAISSSVNSGLPSLRAEQPLDHLGLRLGAEDVGELVGELAAVEALELDPPRARACAPARRAAAAADGGGAARRRGRWRPRARARRSGWRRGKRRKERVERSAQWMSSIQSSTGRSSAEPVGQLEEGVEESALCLAALGLGLGRWLADLGVEPGQLGPRARRDLLEHRVAGALQRPQRSDQRRVGQLVFAELDASPRRSPGRPAARRLRSARGAAGSCRPRTRRR